MLTVIGVAILLMHMPTISRIAEAAALGPVDFARLGAPRLQPLVHAVGGALLLLVTLVLSIYKPWGKTRLGRDRAGQMPAPELFRALLIGAAIVAALVAFIVAHVLGWTPRH